MKANGHGKVELEPSVLEQVIFYRRNDGALDFAIDFKLIKKLDLTGISFDNVDITEKDFSGSKGVKINPQTVWDKDFSSTLSILCDYRTKIRDVEIIGPFDGCKINSTNFTKSKGAKVNPQTVWDKDFSHGILGHKTRIADVEIIGPFYGCEIRYLDFTGSKGAKVDPQTVWDKDFTRATLADAKIIGPFDGCIIDATDFAGSKGAVINPQTVYEKSLHNANLKDATIVNILDDCNTIGTNFDGANMDNITYGKELEKKVKIFTIKKLK